MIYIEDRYGTTFIENLMGRIERDLKINLCKYRQIKSTFGVGGITSKIDNLISMGKNRHECVIFIFDNDGGRKIGKNINMDKKTYVENKVKDTKNVYLIVFEKSIEKDWIEKGINQKLPEDYKKYSLPEYVNKIDLNILKEKDENFKNFITIIDP